MNAIYGSLEVKKSLKHGKGVFSRKHVKKGQWIASFTGKIVTKDSMHVLWIHERNKAPYGIKGEAPLKFLNHSSVPNCEFDGSELYALKDIHIGDELCFHYGEEWDDVP